MYTIQYEAMNGELKTQELDTKDRRKLVIHMAQFTRPICAVYECANVVTQAVRKELAVWPGTLSPHAKAFAQSSAPRNVAI